MGFGVIHNWLELQPGANVILSTASLFHAQEPDIGIEAAVAKEAEKMF